MNAPMSLPRASSSRCGPTSGSRTWWCSRRSSSPSTSSTSTPLAQAALAFAVFCALAGAVYLVNDLADLGARPPAPGEADPAARERRASSAARLAPPRRCSSLWPSPRRWRSGPAFLLCALAYPALGLAYSLALKHVVILDVLAVALGFVLRAVAGAVAIGVHFSPWLLVCTLLLALFLALAKRRHELVTLEDAAAHRQILAEYSPYLLDQMIAVVTASCLTAYAFYTLAPGDRREVPHRAAGAHHPFRDLRHLPLSLPGPSAGARAAARETCCSRTARCSWRSRCGRQRWC